MKELTKAEEQVMQVLWQIKQGFAADIIANFPEPKPAYNTMLTVVRILEKKGFVSHETFGKSNRYYPFKSMVSFFANNQDITLEELDDIRRMIDSVPQDDAPAKTE